MYIFPLPSSTRIPVLSSLRLSAFSSFLFLILLLLFTHTPSAENLYSNRTDILFFLPLLTSKNFEESTPQTPGPKKTQYFVRGILFMKISRTLSIDSASELTIPDVEPRLIPGRDLRNKLGLRPVSSFWRRWDTIFVSY